MDGVQADELELAVVQRADQVHARADVKTDGGPIVAGVVQVVPARGKGTSQCSLGQKEGKEREASMPNSSRKRVIV